MSPRKSTAKKSAKHPQFSPDSFRNDDASIAFTDHYKRALIILERIVDIESLKDTFIPEVFKERTWTKLLNPMGDVFEVIIREFFANAFVEANHINCCVRGREVIVQGSQSKRSWRFVQQLWTPFYIMMRERRNVSLSCKFLEDNSRRRLCTWLSSPPKCKLWPTSWSLTSIRWRTWWPC